MSEDALADRIDAVSVGLLCTQLLFTGLVVAQIGVALYALGEVWWGALQIAIGCVLVLVAKAAIGGRETHFWNATVGRATGTRIDETVSQAFEKLDDPSEADPDA